MPLTSRPADVPPTHSVVNTGYIKGASAATASVEEAVQTSSLGTRLRPPGTPGVAARFAFYSCRTVAKQDWAPFPPSFVLATTELLNGLSVAERYDAVF